MFKEILEQEHKGYKTKDELYDHLKIWAWDYYFTNLYFMLVTLSTVGYGEISVIPSLSDWGDNAEVIRKTDLAYFCFMMLLGLSAFNYLTGRLNIKIQ